MRAATLDRFAAAFAEQDFRAEAMFPCYGMAEATLFITGADLAARPQRRPGAKGRGLVGCGRTGPAHEVRIVDPDTGVPCPDGQVGEIWFCGSSLASGYWCRPDNTARTFSGRLAGQAGPFLRTGDLGLIDGGELYVTGRIKDLIIVRGRNHYPQDIEATVQGARPALRPDGGAAVVIEHEERPQLVVLNDLRRAALRSPSVDEIARAVRAAVVREHGLQVIALALLRPGGLPRTWSGKVRRHAAREGFLAAALPLAGQSLLGFRAPDRIPCPVVLSDPTADPGPRPFNGARP